MGSSVSLLLKANENSEQQGRFGRKFRSARPPVQALRGANSMHSGMSMVMILLAFGPLGPYSPTARLRAA